MIFNPPLIQATLIKRYRRFLTDIRLESGETITIHCPNTGSMMNCLVPESQAWYLPSTDPNRKTKGTWVLATTPHGRIANINTHYANTLVEEALNAGLIKEASPFKTLRREVKYGEENSRIDFCLTHEDDSLTYIEVKSVTLGFHDSTTAAFPDAVTERGTKHLRELTRLAENGVKTILLYCVNLSGITAVRPADEIDPEYGKALRIAQKSGVKIIAYGTELSLSEIKITHSIPVVMD